MEGDDSELDGATFARETSDINVYVYNLCTKGVTGMGDCARTEGLTDQFNPEMMVDLVSECCVTLLPGLEAELLVRMCYAVPCLMGNLADTAMLGRWQEANHLLQQPANAQRGPGDATMVRVAGVTSMARAGSLSKHSGLRRKRTGRASWPRPCGPERMKMHAYVTSLWPRTAAPPRRMDLSSNVKGRRRNAPYPLFRRRVCMKFAGVIPRLGLTGSEEAKLWLPAQGKNLRLLWTK